MKICKGLLGFVLGLGIQAVAAESYGPITEWAVASGGNGHFYQAVAVTNGITWPAAQADAVARGGYLATTTTEEENEFVFTQVDDAQYWHQLPDPNNCGPWLGGFRYEVDGDFFWVTGEDFSYTAWFAGTGEPTGGYWLGQPENYLQYSSAKDTRAPTWNDMINDAPAEYAVYGYIIEYQIHGSATGELFVAIGEVANVLVGYPLELTGQLDGVATMLVWEFADGSSATNNQFPSHAWSAPGDYDVVLTAYNGTHAGGVVATQTVHVINGYSVTFDLGEYGARTGGGELMQAVEVGQGAAAPAVLPNEGWLFQGWDADFNNVSSNTAVQAVYESYSGASGTVVSWAGNEHRYQAMVASDGITWTEAQADAMARGGYLATAVSESENNFIYSLIQSVNYWQDSAWGAIYGPWIGGWQPDGSPEPGGNWQWVSGEPWGYEKWAFDQPNNSEGDESCLHYWKNSLIGTIRTRIMTHVAM